MDILDYIIEKFDGEVLVENQWRVDGSKGDRYTVTYDPHHRQYSCNCKGYSFRKRCRHTKEISDGFKKRFGSLK